MTKVITSGISSHPYIFVAVNGNTQAIEVGVPFEPEAGVEGVFADARTPGGLRYSVPGEIEVGGDTVEPLIFLDFKNGVYTVEGETVALDDVLIENEDFGAWNPENIVDGVGLIGNSTDTFPVFHGDALALILSGSTIVPYFTSPTAEFIFELIDSTDYTTWYRYYISGVIQGYLNDNTTSEALPTVSSGYHRAAFTMTNGKLAQSTDGGAAIVIDPADPWTPPVQIMVMTVGSGVTLETIGLYPPQADADLPALSALS